MARDRANIRTDMWGDEDWRSLSVQAQHLYMLLLTHPTLSYAGVAEWRPGRLAAMTRGASRDSICEAAQELAERLFVVIDEDTEEALVRSFLKYDGLMKQPKLVVSMANAFAATASAKIRHVIAFEVQKLKRNEPDLNAWNVRQVDTVLASTGKPASDFAHDFTLSFTPGFTPNGGQGLGVPTTTATTTTTSISKDIDTIQHDFEKAWKLWPKKTEKDRAEKEYLKHSKNVPGLIDLIERFGDAYESTTEKQFIPSLAAWLHRKRWTDELPAPSVSGKRSAMQANLDRFQQEFGGESYDSGGGLQAIDAGFSA